MNYQKIIYITSHLNYHFIFVFGINAEFLEERDDQDEEFLVGAVQEGGELGH